MVAALVIALLLPGLALVTYVVVQSLLRGKAFATRCGRCGRELSRTTGRCPACDPSKN